ncbi:MAG: thioredoxin [Bacteroidia bacterium]|nr:thioredoxin [Bacteroidia bacterium]MDW8158145.1 thioredoxin [Bacteroidia bacterium]
MGKYTIEITDQNFDQVVTNSDKPVIVDFWAEWCGPCRMIAPVIDKLAENYKDKIVVGKVNVDFNQEVSFRFGIQSIPTILFFYKGQIVDKQVGASPGDLERKAAQLAARV